MASCYNISRRQMLIGSSAFAAWSALPFRSSLAASKDSRLLTIVLRGALDGLSSVMPSGDPQFVQRRAAFLNDVSSAGEPLPLDGFFTLSPHLKNLHDLYNDKQALIVHAIASPYRERSHFDGQDILESGLEGVGDNSSGWMNRFLGTLKTSGDGIGNKGFFIGAATPLIMQGQQQVISIAEPRNIKILSDTEQRVLNLYGREDPALAEAWKNSIDVEQLALVDGMRSNVVSNMQLNRDIEQVMNAAKLMSVDDGPRIAAMSIEGWDTHSLQKPGTGELAERLQTLDRLVGGLRASLTDVWDQTTIMVVTEFGRTVDINGTEGTDHGTATAAFLIGGAVEGGRVISDWPGLRQVDLFEGRDLKPTMDIRALFKGALTEQFDVTEKSLNQIIFPGSEKVPPLLGLTRT